MPAKFAPIAAFSEMSGLGRSKIYNLLGEGELRAVKVGRRTLVDCEHGLAYVAACPAADIRTRAPKAKAAA